MATQPKTVAQMPEFKSILDRPVNSIDRPRPIPVGKYVFAISSMPRQDKSPKTQTELVEFTCKCMGPLDDDSVNQDELEAWAHSRTGEDRKITDVIIRLTYYVTNDAIWRLQRFMEHLGFDVSKAVSFNQLLSETPGQEFIGTVSHTPSQDQSTSYANITATAPLRVNR